VVSATLFFGAEVRGIYIGGFGGGVVVLMIPMGLFLVAAPSALLVSRAEDRGSALPADWSRWAVRWNTRLIWGAFTLMNLLFLGVIWRADLFIPHGAASR
jgi:hypothetical protein